MKLADLEEMLDAYGGAPHRWPSQHRRAAETLIARDVAARKALAEAVALDRLLGHASEPSADRVGALSDRILAAAAGDGGARRSGQDAPPTAAAGRVLRLPVATAPSKLPMAVGLRRAGSRGWSSIAALAASLVFGVAIGATDIGANTALRVVSVAEAQVSGGATSDADVVLSSLQGDGVTGVLDEEPK